MDLEKVFSVQVLEQKRVKDGGEADQAGSAIPQ